MDRCTLKCLNMSPAPVPILFFVTGTINMRLLYLGEISYEVHQEIQRFVHRYSTISVQFRFIHESNKMKKAFSCKGQQNDLDCSNAVYQLKCVSGSTYN